MQDSQIKQNVDRLEKIKGADPGFFLLAMHSLMEKTIKECCPECDYRNVTFETLITSYSEYLKHKIIVKNGGVLPKEKKNQLDELKELIKDHSLTNGVRHRFATVNYSAVLSYTNRFYTFAKLSGWTQDPAMDRIKKIIDEWDKHRESDKALLQKYLLEFNSLKARHSDLIDRFTKNNCDLQNLENELQKIENEKNKLSSENDRLKNKQTKSDERLKELQHSFEEGRKLKRYVEYLQSITFFTRSKYDYERSILKLSDEQEKILKVLKTQELSRDYLIKGRAGTGKSLVLLKTLEDGVTNDKIDVSNFRLLTFDKTLKRYNEYVTSLLGVNVKADSVSTTDTLLKNMLNLVFEDRLDKDNPIISSLDECDSSLFNCEGFTRDQVYDEAVNFIWANKITEQNYLDEVIKRTGMKLVPLRKEKREILWKAIKETEEKLESMNRWPRLFAVKKLSEFIENNKEQAEKLGLFVDFSLVDEVQDLAPSFVSLIKQTSRKAVFLAGDLNQAIRMKGFTRYDTGLDLRHNTYKLTKNYRNSNAIHKFAEEYRLFIPNREAELTCSADKIGIPVQCVETSTLGEAYSEILKRIKVKIDALQTVPENICIISPTDSSLKTLKEKLKNQYNMESAIVDENFDFANTEGIKLCPMKSCKGLEFPNTIILIPGKEFPIATSGLDNDAVNEQQHNLIYVALTRGMEMMDVIMVHDNKNDYPDALKNLKKVFPDDDIN